jgi:hypothetical protein
VSSLNCRHDIRAQALRQLRDLHHGATRQWLHNVAEIGRVKGENTMRRIFIIMLACTTAAGCAQSYQPVVDTKGVDNSKYNQDLAECRQYAEQVNPYERAAMGTAIGALGGAAMGAVTGAVVGNPGAGAAIGAGAGGLTGAAVGGGTGAEQQKKIIDNCLKNRGYAVLN